MTEEKIQKVYLAILNKGSIRAQMASTVIPAMAKTKGVQLTWEDPIKTWANPISSNRNKIVKRFLKTDCDFLLMIDDDVLPLRNPCELVHADRDVVAMPAKVCSPGEVIVWTAYIPHRSGYGYSALDLDSFDDMIDILKVAVVGTGCILIKRKVLETVKAPFHSEFDEDGIQTFGTDFAFCRKATKAGYKIFTTTHWRCEHFKVIGYNCITGCDTVSHFDKSNSDYSISWGEFNVSQINWHFIKNIIKEIKPKRILEFGSGLSSLLMSEICDVISYETDQEYAEKIKAKCLDKNDLTIKLWDGKTCPDPTELFPTKVDLVLVDGSEESKDAATQIASQISDHVIIRNAGGYKEEQHQRSHLRSIFKLTNRSGDHIARCHYWVRRPEPVTLEDILNKMRKKL